MSTFMQDLRFAIRTLKKRWMVTLLAVLSLSLAIGGNAAVFSMVDAFIFRPKPYPEAERVVLVGEREKDQPEFGGNLGTSLPSYADFKERSRSVALWAAMQPATLSLRGTERAEPISAVRITHDFFELLDVHPIRGRTFAEEEGVDGGPRVAILSSEYWLATYGEATDPLGEILTLNGEPHEVIGVMPAGFSFLTPSQDMWVPLSRSPHTAPRDQRTVLALGRLRPEATMEQVRAEMTAVASALEAEFPGAQRGWTVDTYNLRDDIPNRQSRVLFAMLQGSVVLVLLIACVNIMNLLLARGQERASEIALRTALGAARGRIVRQLLTESSIMVAAGGLLGIGFAAVGIRLMAAQFAGVLPADFTIQLDGRVLLFTVGMSVVAGFIFGLVPALQTFKQGHSNTLKEGGSRGGSGRSKKMLSRALVIGEIALSFVALGGGSLLVRSFLELQGTDPGFEAGPLLTAALTVPQSKYPDDADRLLFNAQVLDRATSLGGVQSAALSSALPQSPFATSDTFRVTGEVPDAGATPPRAIVVQASPGYLETMDLGLLQGRFFEEGDRLDGAPVAILSQVVAKDRFAGGSPLGRSLVVRGESREIVGVVEEVRQALLTTGSTQGAGTIYLPVGQEPNAAQFLVLRARGNPSELAEPLRSALLGLDPDLALSQVQTMEDYVAQFFVGIQVFNVVLGGFGLVALLLASLGTYGVLAYSVSQRAQEIGIRMALGAEGRQVVRMIAKQGFWLGSIGLALGALMTLPLVGVLRRLLQGLSTVQPLTLVLIGAILFGVTMVASFVPAARAATVDPMLTLRDD